MLAAEGGNADTPASDTALHEQAAKPEENSEDRPLPPAQRPGEELSKRAIEKRLYRVFQPRTDGSYQVSEDFVKQYKSRGPDRDSLFVLFEKCDHDPERVSERVSTRVSLTCHLILSKFVGGML